MTTPLKPGEVCLMCGSIGVEPPVKVRRVAKAKPGCHFCTKPFTHETPWRLWHGHRAHVACIPKRKL